MGTDLAVFHFDEDRPSFETYCRDNGFRHWLASELKDWLSYASMQPVLNAVNKAMAACAQLSIPIAENFQETRAPTTGGRDWKLSRFACYLTVMNGDPKNQRVAAAQAYFVTMADAFRRYVQESEGVERVLVRGEVSEREKALSATVHVRGVENFAFFQNAGYRGMYNLDPIQPARPHGDCSLPRRRALLRRNRRPLGEPRVSHRNVHFRGYCLLHGAIVWRADGCANDRRHP